METTLHELGQVLLKALPTFFLVLFLHFFLKSVFFGPMASMLEKRREATEGARQQAAASLERASQKAAAYEESLRAARNEIYKEQEELRRRWRDELAGQVEQARKSAEGQVSKAKTELLRQAEEAKITLTTTSRALANEIADHVLRRAS